MGWVVIESMSMFAPSEISLGHVLPTGVVIDKWKTDESGGDVWIYLTAAGIGCGYANDELVGVVGLVDRAMVEDFRQEFADNYFAATGDQMEFMAQLPNPL